MTNREIFLKVALREMAPLDAADQMRREDLVGRTNARPQWLPKLAWTLGLLLFAAVLSTFGVRQER